MTAKKKTAGAAPPRAASAEAAAPTLLARSSWIALLICVAWVPLAVAKLPFMAQPATVHPFGFPQNVILAVGAATALALWAASVLANHARVCVSRTMIAFGVFGLWAVFATVAAYEPLRSLLGGSTAALALVQIFAYLAIAFLVTQVVTSSSRLRALTWTVIASSTLVAVIALLQHFFGADVFGLPASIVEEWRTQRGFSTLGNPDYVGTFLVLPTILSAFMVVFERERRDRWIAGVCLASIAAALAGTLTRGAWVAVAVGFILAGVLLWRHLGAPEIGRRALAALAIALVAAVISVAGAQENVAMRFGILPDDVEQSVLAQAGPEQAAEIRIVNAVTSGRVDLWHSSLLIAAERPLTGTGPAAFELGWYGNAVNPGSGSGASTLVTDPHSLVMLVLATTGVPGLLAFLVGLGGALLLGARNTIPILRSENGPSSRASAHYLAWFTAVIPVQVALLVGAVTAPILLYAFVGLAVLVRPAVRAVSSGVWSRTGAIAAIVFALALTVSVGPNLAAEVKAADSLVGPMPNLAREAALSAPWNLDVQQVCYGVRTQAVARALNAASADSAHDVEAISGDLAEATARQPHEFYYPWLNAELLTRASEKLGPQRYAERAVGAADAAIAIMPNNVSTRVNKALALSDLERWSEMAATLEDYWATVRTSPYPGILYAQALALSGRTDEAWEVFDLLDDRFPEDGSIDAARQQAEDLIGRSH